MTDRYNGLTASEWLRALARTEWSSYLSNGVEMYAETSKRTTWLAEQQEKAEAENAKLRELLAEARLFVLDVTVESKLLARIDAALKGQR
jgi:hypothetical protein